MGRPPVTGVAQLPRPSCLATIPTALLLAVPAMSVELFRYRDVAKDGGRLEYVFESDEKDFPKTATKNQVAEIAAEFMATFYGFQVGALKPRSSARNRCRFDWSVLSVDQESVEQLYFVAILPDGSVVEPRD